MMAKSHIVLSLIPVGIAFETGILPKDSQLMIIAFIGTFIGAILPDIDEPNSYIGRKFIFFSEVLKLSGIKHRTYTHSIFFPFVVAFLGLFHPIFYFIAFGAFMHIIEDFLTNSGVPLFYPFIKEKFGLRFFNTGSIFEYLFVLGSIIAFVLYSYHYSGGFFNFS